MIDTIPADIQARASAARGRALANIEAKDAMRAAHDAESLDQLRRQVHAAQSKLGARRQELEDRRVYLANLTAELEQLTKDLDRGPCPSGCAVVVVPSVSVHDLEHGRSVGLSQGDILCLPTTYLPTVRAKTTRNVVAITREAMTHLIEQGLAEAAPEVSP